MSEGKKLFEDATGTQANAAEQEEKYVGLLRRLMEDVRRTFPEQGEMVGGALLLCFDAGGDEVWQGSSWNRCTHAGAEVAWVGRLVGQTGRMIERELEALVRQEGSDAAEEGKG